MANDALAPTAELADLPAVYGPTTVPLAWEEVRADLESARQYWLTTVRPDGRPHTVPLDGLWLGDAWYYGGSDDTVHVRTALESPQVSMHLPDPLRVVVVEGEVRRVDPGADVAGQLADRSNAKYADYGLRSTASSFRPVLRLLPQRVIAWTNFPTDATRFTFAP